jgi:hypothetical protein
MAFSQWRSVHVGRVWRPYTRNFTPIPLNIDFK